MHDLTRTLSPSSNVHFQCRKETQKYLIHFLLHYSRYDFNSLAELLNINPLLLNRVIHGKVFLNHDVADKLVSWFLIFIGE
jgi:hypothetical protein